MDFLADENVPRPMIARLRSDGLTVHAVAETSAGIPDADVLAAASQGGFILITQDQDFGELAILRQLPVTGVILLELARLALLRRSTVRPWPSPPVAFAGNLTVIEPARMRVRKLPAAGP